MAKYSWDAPGTYAVEVEAASVCRSETTTAEIWVVGEEEKYVLFLTIIMEKKDESKVNRRLLATQNHSENAWMDPIINILSQK